MVAQLSKQRIGEQDPGDTWSITVTVVLRRRPLDVAPAAILEGLMASNRAVLVVCQIVEEDGVLEADTAALAFEYRWRIIGLVLREGAVGRDQGTVAREDPSCVALSLVVVERAVRSVHHRAL